MAMLQPRADDFDYVYATNPKRPLVERIAYCILWGATVRDLLEWEGYEDYEEPEISMAYHDAYNIIAKGDFE